MESSGGILQFFLDVVHVQYCFPLFAFGAQILSGLTIVRVCYGRFLGVHRDVLAALSLLYNGSHQAWLGVQLGGLSLRGLLSLSWVSSLPPRISPSGVLLALFTTIGTG